MTIHYICTGNIYRSRLAEAYCVSKGVPKLHVLSSGIGTSLNRGIPITSYAARLLREYDLERFASPLWQQTTPALVRASDVLVFMEREHYDYCTEWLDSSRQRINIWDIADVGPGVRETEITTEAERTFAVIRRKTDLLLTELGF